MRTCRYSNMFEKRNAIYRLKKCAECELDGKEGLIFHFLQDYGYRFLIDARTYEDQLRARQSKEM